MDNLFGLLLHVRLGFGIDEGFDGTVHGHQSGYIIIKGKQVINGIAFLITDIKGTGFQYLAVGCTGKVSKMVF